MKIDMSNPCFFAICARLFSSANICALARARTSANRRTPPGQNRNEQDQKSCECRYHAPRPGSAHDPPQPAVVGATLLRKPHDGSSAMGHGAGLAGLNRSAGFTSRPQRVAGALGAKRSSSESLILIRKWRQEGFGSLKSLVNLFCRQSSCIAAGGSSFQREKQHQLFVWDGRDPRRAVARVLGRGVCCAGRITAARTHAIGHCARCVPLRPAAPRSIAPPRGTALGVTRFARSLVVGGGGEARLAQLCRGFVRRVVCSGEARRAAAHCAPG